MLKKKHALGETSPLDRVPLVASLTAEQRVHLAEQMTERKFAPDGAVVVAGCDGIGFFVSKASR